MLKIYNTLTRSVEVFKPLDGKIVNLYTCGPTVYDRLHVGNWVAYIRWDILVRTLELAGYKVKRVMNITDVGHLVSDGDEGEDKLEKGARREGITAWDIARKYTDDFMTGMNSLNLIDPFVYAKATDHIEQQIEFIKVLESKNITYTLADGVYFDISKFPNYAAFAHLDLADQKSVARIESNPNKKQPQDFALWKFSPKQNKRDMEWDSPWGLGFPGWHLECSAMAKHYLGDTLDIHTGGIDHIPVHHTNEIAQSESANGVRLSNYWLHNNFMLVDNNKISKSLQNGVTLDDLAKKGFSPLDFKLLVLQSHYRSESHFSWTNLEAAHNRLISLRAMAALKWQPIKMNSWLKSELNTSKIKNALFDDLNTPEVLSELSRLATLLEENLVPVQELEIFSNYLEFLDSALGLKLSDEPNINEVQKDLIAKRDHARSKQNWEQADNIRQELLKLGIGLRDTDSGSIWFRT